MQILNAAIEPRFQKQAWCTNLKVHIAPERWWFRMYLSFWDIVTFQGIHVQLREGNDAVPQVHMKMIFEIRDLNYATPATATRAGIVCWETQWRAKFGVLHPGYWWNKSNQPLEVDSSSRWWFYHHQVLVKFHRDQNTSCWAPQMVVKSIGEMGPPKIRETVGLVK